MTKHIQILGPGCSKCKKLAANVRQATAELGIEYTIEKVTDVDEMLKFGVMMTPALVVDGKVLMVGKAANAKYVKKLLQQGPEV